MSKKTDKIGKFRDNLYQYCETDFYDDNGAINLTNVIKYVDKLIKEVREETDTCKRCFKDYNAPSLCPVCERKSLYQQRKEIIEKLKGMKEPHKYGRNEALDQAIKEIEDM